MFNFNCKFTNFPSFHPSVNRHFEIIIITSFHLYAVADWLEARLQTSGTRTIAIYLHSQIQKDFTFNRSGTLEHTAQMADIIKTTAYNYIQVDRCEVTRLTDHC